MYNQLKALGHLVSANEARQYMVDRLNIPVAQLPKRQAIANRLKRAGLWKPEPVEQ